LFFNKRVNPLYDQTYAGKNVTFLSRT